MRHVRTAAVAIALAKRGAFVGAGALIALVLAAPPSKADVLQESVDVGGEFTNPNTGETGFTIPTPAFDTSLGTLEHVSLDLKGNFIAGAFYQFAGPVPVPPPPTILVPLATSGEITLAHASATFPSITLEFDCSPSGCYSAPFNDVFPFEIQKTLRVDDFLPSGSEGGLFVGGGLRLPLSVDFFPNMPATTFVEDTSYFGGTLTLDFTYNRGHHAHVPEPSTVALLVSGLVGIGAARRIGRANKRKK